MRPGETVVEVYRGDCILPRGVYAIGPATIAGYTVMFNRETPSHAIAICDTPGGARTVVRTEDEALLEAMTREESCGRVVQARKDGHFGLAQA